MQQIASRCGCSLAQRYRGNLQGGAGYGRALVGGPLGVAQHHVHLVHAQVQLFGDDLRQRGTDASAQVDMAIEGVDHAVVADRDEQRQLTFLDCRCHALGHRA
ncbi:hypothetical protein D3C72_1884330 [compost metagenome]